MPIDSGWFDQGLALFLRDALNRPDATTAYSFALLTSDTMPAATMKKLSDLTEIATGNGYTSGGIALTPLAVNFPDLEEDDPNNRGTITIADLSWVATGGPLPASGNPIHLIVMADDNGTPSLKKLYAWWDFGADYTKAAGLSFIVSGLGLRLRLPP